jgi:hypothetical protein
MGYLAGQSGRGVSGTYSKEAKFMSGGTAAFTSFLFCGIAIVVVAIVIVIFSAIRIVPEYQRLVVFRLGRVIGQ